MQKIKLNFSDFWSGLDKTNNYFYNLLSQYYEIEISDNPDFLIYSTFGKEYLQYDCVRIFFTGENVRPDFNLCDYAIGFDYMQFEDRYFRYPLYMLYKKSWDKALKKHEFTRDDLKQKTGFCNFIYSNSNTQTNRDEFFDRLSDYKRVDSGGRHRNNIGGPVDDKVEWQSHYKFSIAFENSIQNGYQTEKLIEAFAARTIPIYFGNPKVLSEINPDSFIICNSIDEFDDVIQRVKAIDNDDDLYMKMLQAPMLKDEKAYMEMYGEDKLVAFLKNIFDSGSHGAMRRNNYTLGNNIEQEAKLVKKVKESKLLSRLLHC